MTLSPARAWSGAGGRAVSSATTAQALMTSAAVNSVWLGDEHRVILPSHLLQEKFRFQDQRLAGRNSGDMSALAVGRGGRAGAPYRWAALVAAH